MTITIPTPTDTTADTVEALVTGAADAAAPLAAMALERRAALLDAVADTLDAHADELVPLAHEETNLPLPRLTGEVARTTGQLRRFAAVVRDGAFLEAVVDHAVPDATPPQPDLRRMLVPLGPTLVFSASNFPFAFSVAGGDTASALAAGCPVVVKAHPGHPRLSVRTAELVQDALAAAGAPAGSFALVHGLEAGIRALEHPLLRAAAFTGSTSAGRMLFDIAAARPEPIPFYGELGSTNPVFVTRDAVSARGAELVEQYVASFTLGAGQFCTKPGLLLLPAGHGLDETLAAVTGAVEGSAMLNESLHNGFVDRLRRLSASSDRVLHAGTDGPAPSTSPTLLAASLAQVRAERTLLDECFGPVSLVVEYDDEDELVDFAAELDGQLTATIQAEEHEADRLAPLLAALADRAGRVLWNGWPTGVAVTWAMHHGGPYPATTSALHTAVGASAVRRFQRPVCFQDLPEPALPEALREDNPLHLPRRVDGRLVH
ncbi:aldehyde dehydrogenase (NADP(+)) [Nocardioides sp. NPDC057767]|uniref:aldehyde dehydrogenase (NADP(+)) n=1 Tax=unclassified Nocardioides TaxID=2615069 RepID=UPI00366CA625